MIFQFGAETDMSFPREEWGRLVHRLIDYMRAELEKSSLKDSDWTLGYVPILMAKENADLFPARSRCLHKKKRLNVALS